MEWTKREVLTTLAWPVAGAAVGFSVGILVSAQGRSPAVVLVALSVLVLGLLVMAILLVARAARRARAARTAYRSASPEADSLRSRGPLFVEIELPGEVWGVGEPLEVRARVAREGAITRGADVSLALGRASGELRALARGPSDADGVFAHPLVVAEPGAVRLVADAAHEGLTASATRSLRIVRWSEEIQKLFVDFRGWAMRRAPGIDETATAREVVASLAARRGALDSVSLRRDLDEIARIYEIVAYGARPADRALYLSVRESFRSLENAGFFEEASPFV